LLVVIAGVGVGIVGAVLIGLRVTWAAIPVRRLELFVAGIVLMVLGTALRAWSVVILGRNFTVYVQVRDEQPVVDTGPYRLLRHPSYTGLLVVCLGIGLALGNWLALVAVVVVPTIAILLRIRVEERALLAGIGEPYRRFAATRKRLIPWVWWGDEQPPQLAPARRSHLHPREPRRRRWRHAARLVARRRRESRADAAMVGST
jgi:protein-S-isoprenylcysteine O-methyltransferase Ste14